MNCELFGTHRLQLLPPNHGANSRSPRRLWGNDVDTSTLKNKPVAKPAACVVSVSRSSESAARPHHFPNFYPQTDAYRLSFNHPDVDIHNRALYSTYATSDHMRLRVRKPGPRSELNILARSYLLSPTSFAKFPFCISLFHVSI